MKGKFKANYISQRQNEYNGKQYFYASFNDGVEDFEVETRTPISIPRFADCELTVDVIQGKYPKFRLVEHSIIK